MSDRTQIGLGATVLALLIAAAGCGGESKSEGSSAPAQNSATSTAPAARAGTTLSLAADPSRLRFNKDSLSAKAGIVTIKMSNPSSLPHNIGITGESLPYRFGPTVRKGGTSTVTAQLKPGIYEFLCGVDGHEGAGMSGKLVVR